MSRTRNKRKPMSEINVVPYIDVMLVLLIIFMVTAPMLMQGVKVDLPEASADPVENQDSEPVIVSVNAAGELFLNLGQEDQVLSLATIRDRVAAVMRRSPEKPVLVWGDRAVPYGEVVTLMAALQEAGAFCVLMEMVPAELATQVDRALRVPTIGIGAGNGTTGQVLVWQDMLGLGSGRVPRFVKQYAILREVVAEAAGQYRSDVSSGSFPAPEHSFEG